nr:urea transporter [Bacteroidales bacterium]
SVMYFFFFCFYYFLTSIALGGFFIIPSFRSYLWVVILIPLVAIVTISLHTIFLELKLPVYSLPFNMVVLLFIYILKFRPEYSYSLTEAYYQYNSPEKNLYIFLNNAERFRHKEFRPIKLPFFGAWDISQGHNGEHTHKDMWRHAWDFVILNKDGKQFKNTGDFHEDYFCFGKPVIAPDEGTVDFVVNDIEDNIIGEVNLQDNWGNTIIIKHDDNVYTKLCHLKKGSVKVMEGDKVKYGQVLAQCGNSGRSPYPHLHFQVQEFQFVGSATIDYPISNYVLHQKNTFLFNTNKRPQKDDKVSNIEVNPLLRNAFHFTPGEILSYDVKGFKNIKKVQWEVKVNPYNESYMECSKSGAIAYFEQDENLFHFTYFEGSKNCLLYYFFLGAYKVQEGYYQGLELTDNYPLSLVYPKWILWFQDFISPFFLFAKANYTLKYKYIDDYMDPSSIKLSSSIENQFFAKKLNSMHFQTEIKSKGVQSFVITEKEKTIELTRCEK